MAEAPAMNEPLTEDRTAEIAELLLPVQANTLCLGIKLTLQLCEVEAIHMRYPEPRDRLLQIVIQFLRQANPTWRLIIDALRSRLVNFPGLARRLEDYIVQPVVVVNNHVVVPQPLCAVRNDHGNFAMLSIQNMQQNIASLRNKFDVLKNHIRQCLEMRRIPVERVADALTTLSADHEEQQRLFLESHVSALFRAGTHCEQFGTMNFHWNYLNTPVMENLAQKFDLEEVKVEMETYKSELRQFRRAAPLALFAQAHMRRHVDPPPHFRRFVIEFDWPENVTLQNVEEFRQIYASHYNLHECAMMLAHVRPGSFIITWFIPESVVKKLLTKVPRVILKENSATKLDISGTCVYQLRKEKVPLAPPLSSVPANEIADGGYRACQQKREDYPFVVQPPDHFFCPVTFGLLLQPHLTSCCGKHLSQEAATKKQGDGEPCPHCNTAGWSTVLNRHFHRQVNSLRVFCRYEESGCEWQGELRDLDSHPCTVSNQEKEMEEKQKNQHIIIKENEIPQDEVKGLSQGTELQTKLTEAQREVRKMEIALIQAERGLNLAEQELRKKENDLESTCPGIITKSKSAISNLDRPYGIAFNESGKMVVSEWGIHRVCVLDKNKKVQIIKPELMKYPSGIAVHKNNIFVASKYWLLKFNFGGDLISKHNVKRNLENPRGLAVHDNLVYVTDRNKHCIQVFDLDLNLFNSIGSRGKGEGEFDDPFDVKFDSAGNMYVAEFGNKRIQVMDTSGTFRIDREKVGLATGLHVIENKVYISEFANDSLLAYDTSDKSAAMVIMASVGQGIGELIGPYGITSHDDKLYVCDSGNNRVHIFDLDS